GCFKSFLANVFCGFLYLDLVQVGAFVRHGILLGVHLAAAASDLSHVTKGHQHCQEPRPSLTMMWGTVIRVSARLFILRVNHRVYVCGGAGALRGGGRSGV